ncbi:hypothetical protein ABZZ01_21625, partial [Streptomyces virginiae]
HDPLYVTGSDPAQVHHAMARAMDHALDRIALNQGQPASLVAVTARSNRSKADQDPAHGAAPVPGRAVPIPSRADGDQDPLGPRRRRVRERPAPRHRGQRRWHGRGVHPGP